MKRQSYDSYLTNALQCYEISQQEHKSTKKHEKIQIKQVKKIVENLTQLDGEEWLGYMDKLQNKLEDMIDALKQITNEFNDRFFQERLITTCYMNNQYESNKKEFVETIKKVEENRFEKLTCHQVDKIVTLNKEIANKPKIKLEEQFKKVEAKIGEDILEVFYKIFTAVPKNTSIISEEMIAKKIEKILKEKDLLKGKENKIETQNQKQKQKQKKVQKEVNNKPKKSARNDQRNDQRNDPKEQRYQGTGKAPKKKMWSQDDDDFDEDDYLQSSRQRNNNQKNFRKQPTRQSNNFDRPARNNNRETMNDAKPKSSNLIMINQINSQQGKFDIVLRILTILEQRKINRLNCRVCLVGDQSGIAEAVLKRRSSIEVGNTLLMTNCRTYKFRQSLQIQDSRETQITDHSRSQPIRTIGKQSLSAESQRQYLKRAKIIEEDLGITRKTGNNPRSNNGPSNTRSHNNGYRTENHQDYRKQYRKQGFDRKTEQNSHRPNNINRNNNEKVNQSTHSYNRPQRANDDEDFQAYRARMAAKRQQRKQRMQNIRNQNGANNRNRNEQQTYNKKSQNFREEKRSEYKQSQKQQNTGYNPRRRNQTQNRHHEPQRHQKGNLIKIQQISPGEQNLNFFGEVTKILKRSQKSIIFNVGDQTGIVECFVPIQFQYLIQLGKVIQFINFQSRVQNEHIIMKRNGSKSLIQPSNKIIKNIFYKNNISAEQFQEDSN